MKDYFSEEYIQVDNTYKEEDKELKEDTVVKIEHEKYGISKPKRKIIKARVIK